MKYAKLIGENGNLTNKGSNIFSSIKTQIEALLSGIEDLDKQKLLTLQSVINKEISDIVSNFKISENNQLPKNETVLTKELAKELIKNYIDNR